MPRPKSYDRETVLDRAMHVFWRRGYTATSVQHLTEATGLNRFSLYNEFEDKRSLFAASLDRYLATQVTALLAPIEAPGAGPGSIEAFFGQFVDLARQGATRDGCLICNTAAELVPSDAEAAQHVRLYTERLRQAFASALREESPSRLPDYLVGATLGLFMLAKSGATPEAIAHYIETVLSTLD